MHHRVERQRLNTRRRHALQNVQAQLLNHRGARTIAMYARQQIPSGTELVFDYGKSYKRNSRRNLV